MSSLDAVSYATDQPRRGWFLQIRERANGLAQILFRHPSSSV